MGKKAWFKFALVLLAVCFVFAACSKKEETAAAGGVAKLSYTFWGSDMERDAQFSAVQQFNELNAGIAEVTPLHIPSTGNEYTTRITAMQASGTNPDIGYLGAGMAYTWAREGILYNIFDLMEADNWNPGNFVDDIFYMYDEGKSFGTTSSINPYGIFYDPALFDQLGVEYPPATYADAWEWDEFVANAKKLTLDFNGNNANSPNFDPQRIRQYGILFNPDDMYIFQLMLDSNGADLLNKEGTALALDTPEAKEVLQKLYDLIYVHHVAPIPADYANLPSGPNAIANRQFAMVTTGYWVLLDFARLNVPFQIGVLPKLKEPRNFKMAGVRCVFANTKYPDEAWELYKFLANPEGALNLYKDGLWMPTLKEWYTDPAKFAQWAEGNPAHPETFKTVFADSLFNGVSTPNWTLRINNMDELVSTIIRPALQQYWLGDMGLEEVVADVMAKASPFVRGYNPGMKHASEYWKFQQ